MSLTHTQQPVQIRPRAGKACTPCKKAKQRCEPASFGANDQPCRRCVSRKLDCDITRSQSPSLGQPGPAPYSANCLTDEPTLGPHTYVHYTGQSPQSVPMGRWPTLQQQGQRSCTTIIAPEQTQQESSSFLPLPPTTEDYQQGLCCIDPEARYYSDDYYGEEHYMAGYAPDGAGDGKSNLRYIVEEPRSSNGYQ